MSASVPIIAPSILSADFSRLAEALAVADPTLDWVHCDVMDNHFVPNLTFGPLLIEAARRLTAAYLDVHLMIERPWDMVAGFRDAGADEITVHVEACPTPRDVLRQVRATGAHAGLAIKPGTPLGVVEPFLADLDTLLVMTVEPGFGGQAFMPEMLDKVRAASALRARRTLGFRIEVDGGINAETARLARAAGADTFVAGNSVYHAPSPRAALLELREAVAGAVRA